MLKRNRFIAILITALCLVAPDVFASTGCNYPTTLDSWSDKIAGDFLTIADVNQFRCAIEKVEVGPLRPNDGSQGAPAYAFRTSAGTGVFLPSASILAFSTNSTEKLRINSNGSMTLGNAASTGVGTSDFVLANNKNILWVNAAASTAANLWVKGTTSDTLSFGTNGAEVINIATNGSVRVGNSAITGAQPNGIVLKNNTPIQWLNAAGSTTGNHYIQNNASDHMLFNVPAVDGQLFLFDWGNQPLVQFARENGSAQLMFLTKTATERANPAANAVVLYQKDNGSGKGQLCARFPTGTSQCFATEP